MPEQEYIQMFGEKRETMIAQTKEEIRNAAKEKDWGLFKELVEKLKKVYIGDDVFWANEVGSNLFVSLVMGLLAALILITILLNSIGVYEFRSKQFLPVMIPCMVMMLLGIMICLRVQGERRWMKYLLMLMVCITIAACYSVLGSRALLAVVIPVAISVRYYSERFTIWVAIIMGIFFLGAVLISVYVGDHIDMNVLRIPAGTVIPEGYSPQDFIHSLSIPQNEYIKDLLTRRFLPDILQYIVIVVICIKVSKWGHETIVAQAGVATEFSRMDTELKLARDIQENILPNLFPPYPDRNEFGIYATMEAAKEVGGDFYDFFLIDDNHLCMVMADVSGKGVPAALFMMISKVMIKTQAMQGLSPANILRTVNEQLCENDEIEMFVTAWVGILEIDTGIITASNAGHEYPVLARKEDKTYQIYKDRHGFVLGGMATSKYREYTITLQAGDSIFLYTDGVTEATNENNDLFGMERMVDALNQPHGDTQEEVLKHVRDAINRFTGDISQFDDITMMGLQYNGIKKAEK